MENGQAGDSPDTIDDLAAFLVDNPGADQDPDEREEGQTSDEPDQTDNSDEPDEDSPADEKDEKSDSEDAEKQPSGLKFKVPVKGEDGAESTIEVDEKELIAGYQRHADYTRKAMALGEREREITQVVATRLEQGQQHYLKQATAARAAVERLAGLRSPQEMFELSRTSPQAWAEETERANLVRATLAEIEQGIQLESWQQQEQAKQQTAQQISHAWGVLGQQGINKPKLAEIYETVHKKYAIPKERLANVTDPALVLVLRDAAAFQGLKDKKAAVTQKVDKAPKLPTQRQSVPRNEQVNKRVQAKFSSGKAKIRDLASFLESNNL